MDLKTLINDVKNASAKADKLIGPLEELAGMAGFLIPGAAGQTLKEGVAVLKFIQAHESAIGNDLTALATDLEGAFSDFKAALGKPADAAAAAAPAAAAATAPAAADRPAIPGAHPEA